MGDSIFNPCLYDFLLGRTHFHRAFLQGGRVTLLYCFRLSRYMSGRVTLGVGSPYHLGRVTLLVGLAVCLLKPCKSSKEGYPRRRAISVGLDMK